MPLRRLRNGTYEARYYRDGTKRSPYIRENFGRVTPDRARELYRDRLAVASKRRSRGGHHLTFRAAAIAYLRNEEQRKSPTSLERTESILELHAIPRFGDRRIETITAAEVETWMADLVRGGLSKATANRAWNTVRAVLRWSVRKLDAACPALGRVEAFKLPHSGAKIVYLEPEEWQKLLTAFDDEEAFRAMVKDRRMLGPVKIGATSVEERRYGGGLKHDSEAADAYLGRLRACVPVFEALLYTGARVGDVVNLRWRDVDLKRKTVIIRQAKSGSKPVILPIAEQLLDRLRSLGRGVGDAYVFTFPDGSPITTRQVQRAIAVARRLTGLRRIITPHVLRHTFGSWLAMAGVSLREIQELLGQSSPVITAKHYAHLSPRSLKRGIGVISKVARKVARTTETAAKDHI